MEKKVNINRPQISADEIAKRKDVNSLLQQHVAMKPFYKKPWFWSGAGIATVGLVASLILVNNKNKDVTKLPITAATESVDSIALEKFYIAEQAKPCVNPPLPDLNIPSTIYKVVAEKGATIETASGSKISVPKNSFLDKNGKTVKGEVELHYREFHDAVDFFVSGIPMTYDSAGVRYQFESAGMIEVQGFQNGLPVTIASGKKINVELTSTYSGTDYNLYQLDTEQNNWSCLGKDKVVKTTISAAGSKNETNKDITQSSEFKAITTKKEEALKVKETQIAALPKLSTVPKKPEQSRKDKYTFNLDVDVKEFPELALYKGVLFEVGTENKNFTSAMYAITWDEAIIKEGSKKGENYLLTLTKASKKQDVIVYPVFEGKNYESALKDYQEKFSKYTTALEKRKADEKKIEEAYQAQIALLKKQQDDLERKWKEQENSNFNLMSANEKVQRMFTVSNFGIYNCDKPSLYPTGVQCKALLNSENQKRLMCYEVYLVDRKKNGIFTYSKNPVTNFSFNPKSKNLLWTVENGVLYWLKPEQFNEISSSEGVTSLTMNKVEQKFKNVNELKAFFNF